MLFRSGASVPDWPAFPDSPEALARLAARYRLIILSNVDRTSFAGSNRRLGVTFTSILTAQDIGSYKPSPRNFAALAAEREDVRLARECAAFWAVQTRADSPMLSSFAPGSVVNVVPEAVQAHIRETGALRPHLVQQRTDGTGESVLLDLPLPRRWLRAPWVCSTCKRDKQYRAFPVTRADISREFPGVLCFEASGAGNIYMTRAFLLHFLQLFYEEFNMRAVRRRLCDYYAANCLAFGVGQRALSLLQGLPGCKALRLLAVRALRNFVHFAVARLQRLQCIYNAQIGRAHV